LHKTRAVFNYLVEFSRNESTDVVGRFIRIGIHCKFY